MSCLCDAGYDGLACMYNTSTIASYNSKMNSAATAFGKMD
jgi:hypothetical protein